MSAVGRDAAAPFEVDRLEGARIGPYRVERLVSTGGAGAILAARHAESGQEVALKLLRGLEPEEQEGLRREVHVLSRLSHHGVVRVYDAGVHAIGPWYAMELIRGETLAARWGSRPALLLSDSLRILRDLSETLAFVHGEGIVHRDLKPANLMLRAGQAPVLVDFGFASHAPAAEARELLERTGQLVGSLAYASPEQIRGEQVDARSDLYSLGCMLFEAAAGHPPFGSEGPNLLLRHLAEPSPDLLRAAPSAPPQLAALVASLLSKNPRDRVGYAEDVARKLSTLLPGGRQARDSSAPAYLYRPHFVGREEALASFDGALESAKAGAGRALLVTAESGAGKTRLAREVTARAADHGFEVVLGNCVPTSGTEGEPGLPGAPLHPFSALLRAMADHCRHEGPEMTHAIFGAGARILVSFEPSIATVPGFDALPTPPPLSGEAARSRTIARLQDALRAFGQRAPLLLVLDDLQWADEMTLSALRACTRIVGELPLVLVATARSEEMPDAMHELGRWPAVGVMDLERLGRPQVAAMVSDML
ncbi:MAG: AAA family ATPase, partial [Myxococcota bacterium]